LAAAAASAANVQAVHRLHGESAQLSACMCEGIPQSEKQPSLTRLPATLTLCGCPSSGPEGAVRGGGLSLEQHSSMHGPHGPLHSRAPCLCLCLCQLPELPLPLQLLMVPLLSGQPLSWGQGLQERVRGSTRHAGSSFSKPPSKPLLK